MESVSISPARSSMKRSREDGVEEGMGLGEGCGVKPASTVGDEAVSRMDVKGDSGTSERDLEMRSAGSEGRTDKVIVIVDSEDESRSGGTKGIDHVDGKASTILNATPTPSAFTALNGSVPPPPKRAKLTFAEKENRRILNEIRAKEKADENAKREAKRVSQIAEKARRDAELEVERKKRNAEKEAKRQALEAEKAAKEEKRKLKEEEKLKAEEEKKKKEGKQMKLGNFFAIPVKDRGREGSVGSNKERSSASPAPSNSNLPTIQSPSTSTPNKPIQSAYEKAFLPFHKYEDVTVAPYTRFNRDDSALEILQTTIDSCLYGHHSPIKKRKFHPQQLFYLSNTAQRGRKFTPVKEIMNEMSNNSSKVVDLTTDSQNSQIKKQKDLLKAIPFKILHFQEDVRPPYKGTYTKQPLHGMSSLAQNPMRRDLPDTDYDYDSEAEWAEDEDAEDLASEAEDEEEIDEDEDMEGFLDDEHDELNDSKRLVLQGDLEPVSTGLCWEDKKKKCSNVKMVEYRMEVILDPTLKSIDPFSTEYWPQPKSKSNDPSRQPLNSMKPPNHNPSNTNKSVKPFFTPTSSSATSSSTNSNQDNKSTTPPKKMIPDCDMAAFKAAIQGSDLSKVGLVEVLKKKFPGRSGVAIKDTLEVVAKRVGAKLADKRWVVDA